LLLFFQPATILTFKSRFYYTGNFIENLQAAIMLASAFKDAGEGLVELRRIEAAEDIAYQLAKSRNVTYLPTGQSTLVNLPANANA